MKVGIITVHDSANFGSFLQAYALKIVLKDMGHDVKFIKTRSDKEVKKIFQGSIKNYMKYFSEFIYNKEKYKIFLKDFKKNSEVNLEEVTKETFDVLIIGSDELWNVNTPVFRNSYFYGKGLPTRKKIAYAISCGNAEKQDLNKYPELLESIKKLDQIFVRDEKTQSNLKDLLNINCEMVCDPTLLVDVQKLQTSYNNPISEKYILIYTYYLNEKMVKKIKQIAQDKNLKLVSVCMKQKWCDYNLNCSPLEFCEVIKDAQYVVTTTFHGTIFSILNKKNFVTLPFSCKVNDLLKKVDLYDRIVNEDDSLENIEYKLNEEIDYLKCDRRIEEMRKESLNLLKNNIESE